ncbi:MAG: Unknown protein [uncultured Sulfurovum sp.]|uniref:Uncharacterized protein n=1 Tax=uncultured Sulfurovum sp. TaxID=269237 RepID=A0A6S6S5D6_9BACT|nr:MAG: Unknown protein [uncultured Sulfurovum sp.]
MQEYSIAYAILAFIVLVLKNDIKDKFFFSLTFILITLAGLFSYEWKDNFTAWDIFSALGGSSTIALALLALLGYLDYIRQEEEVSIWLHVKDDKGNIIQKEDTNFSILRKNCTRQELQGILGVIADVPRYELASIKESEFMKDIDAIQIGKKKKIAIIVSQEKEAYQFNSIFNNKYKKIEKLKTQTSLRIDKDSLHDAKKILNEVGMNFSEEVNIFTKMIVTHKGLSFEVKIHNDEVNDLTDKLQNALKEVARQSKEENL